MKRMNRPHLRWCDYDNNGDILPDGYKRLKDGTIVDTTEMKEKERRQTMIDRTYSDDTYEYMSQDPCDYCIEMECENNGNVCPLWWKYNKADMGEIDNDL